MPDRGVKRSFDTASDFATNFPNRVRGLDFANLVFIEVFSGTAGLTAAVRRAGCQHGTGVDAHVTKQVKAPVIRINLVTQPGQEFLWRILQQPRVFAVHLGPPCGTSSRAREIKRRFGYNPKPLRSEQYPDGLPRLPAKDQARVDTANTLYKLSGEILAFTTARGILCSLENPLRSHMWNTSFLRNAIDHLSQQLFKVQFHHCMFGGRRRNRTQLLVNQECYKHLQRNCDETHTHEPWGRTSLGWATSLEVEYPHALCREWATCLRHAAVQHGALDMPDEMSSDKSTSLNHQAKAALGVHVRGKRLKPLMRECSSVVRISGPHDVLSGLPKVVTTPFTLPPTCQSTPPTMILPTHAKLIQPPLVQGDSAGQMSTDSQRISQVDFGIPWKPMEFVKRANGLSHPGHFLDGVHEVLLGLFAKMATTSTQSMAQDRTAAMRKWTLRLSELKALGNDGLESSPEHAKLILKDKNMKLFAEMVEASGSPDANIAEDVAKGFDLMGPMPAGGPCPYKPLHATLLPDQVRDMAPLAREATWSAVKRSKGDTMCEEIYNSALEECSRGWMRGPFSFDELPERAILTRRFGVRQSSTSSDGVRVMKFRPIHDFSKSLISATNSCEETIQPMGVDQICASLVKRMRVRPGDRLVCKTVELRKAYKNLPLSSGALQDSYIVVFSPSEGRPQAFQTLVLPFGARAAVMGFCRTSYAIWRIGVVIFGLHWTVYFDDYFLVAEVSESRHVDMAQQLLFMILGWQTSSEKEGGFNAVSRILGVQIDLAEAHLGVAAVHNVESRMRELVTTIDEILGRGTLSVAEMRALRGRLVFC